MKYAIILAFVFLSSFVFSQENQDWTTFYKQSNFKETPRYDATIDYCKRLAEASPMVHYTNFGISPQGRELPLLIVDKDGLHDAASIRSSGKAVLLVEACIHPGESEGKDAGLMLIREMAISKSEEALLDKVSLMFIPIFNVDGHERFGKYNRINQNGPEEMGWRVTAQNLNLNRDFLKADAPEMRDWLRMFSHWLPDFFIDCHTTDGADYQYVATYVMEVFGNMDAGLTQWVENTYLPEMEDYMFSQDFPVFPYVSFRKWHDPRSGLYRSAAPPMLSQGYTALQNRPGLLIETHMLKPYKPRVESTYELIKFSMQMMNDQHDELLSLIREADLYTASVDFRKNDFPIDFETSMNDSVMVDFLGVEYDIVESDLSGGLWHQYHADKPKTFRLPLFKKVEASARVTLPDAYIIPAEWTEVIERIDAHGISYTRLDKDTEFLVESYRFENPRWQRTPYEGRQKLRVKSIPVKEKRIYPKGSVLIDMNQRAARLVAYMLEPESGDSYISWGFFNSIFEQKEYAETYVMEPLARKMLKENDSIRKAFEALKKDGYFEDKSQWEMMNWFYRQSPWRDKKLNLYPVGRIYHD